MKLLIKHESTFKLTTSQAAKSLFCVLLLRSRRGGLSCMIEEFHSLDACVVWRTALAILPSSSNCYSDIV